MVEIRVSLHLGLVKLTRIGVNKESDITFGQVVNNGGFGEIGHVGQIFKQFVLWRILFFNFVICISFFFTVGSQDLKFCLNILAEDRNPQIAQLLELTLVVFGFSPSLIISPLI